MSQANKFTFTGTILLGINSIVGSGIFLLPSDAYKTFGPYSIWAILFTAMLVLCFALCFAEMSSKFSKNGGAYTYSRETFGNHIGFQAGWLNFFSATMTWSASAVGFATILGVYVPFVNTPLGTTICSCSVIFISAFINLLGVRESELSNNFFTTAKLIPLGIFILIGFFYIDFNNFTLDKTIAQQNHIEYSLASAVLLFFYVFSGFEMLPVAAKDMDNPKKNIPLALIIVIVFVTVTYFIILLNTIGILGLEVIHSTHPIADAMEKIVGQWGFYFIWVTSLISIFGILLATAFDGPRTLSSLAEDKFLPNCIASYSKKNVPANATIFMAIVASIIANTGSFSALIKAESIVLIVLYLPTCLAVIVTRRRNINGNFKIPFPYFIVSITVILSIYLIISATSEEIVYGLTAIIVGIILYVTYAYHHHKKYMS